MVDEQPAPELTPESAKALADKVIDSEVIPKKIPHIEDVDAQTKALGGALASALLTATEMPIHTLQPVIGDLAAQLVALGVRQTEHVDPEAVNAPTWITDGVRQESIKLPEQPKHTDAEPAAERTAQAPEPPKKIAHAARAVKR